MWQHDPRYTDRIVLEFLYKSMPAEQLEQAELEGMFDLLKGHKGKEHLHPELVLIHGKHGPYYAHRHKTYRNSP